MCTQLMPVSSQCVLLVLLGGPATKGLGSQSAVPSSASCAGPEELRLPYPHRGVEQNIPGGLQEGKTWCHSPRHTVPSPTCPWSVPPGLGPRPGPSHASSTSWCLAQRGEPQMPARVSQGSRHPLPSGHKATIRPDITDKQAILQPFPATGTSLTCSPKQ